MTIAESGSFYEKMRESLTFAETRRKRVSSRRWEMIERARVTLMNRRREATPAVINVVADDALLRDEVFNNSVSDEQWGTRLTTMYAVVELVRAQHETNALLRKILTELNARQHSA